MDGGGNHFRIPVFSGESSGKIKIIRPHDFDIPCVGFQLGGDIDFPESVPVTDSRKNSSGQIFLEDKGRFLPEILCRHALSGQFECLEIRRSSRCEAVAVRTSRAPTRDGGYSGLRSFFPRPPARLHDEALRRPPEPPLVVSAQRFEQFRRRRRLHETEHAPAESPAAR